eukprot:gene8695-642_t
MSLKTLEGNIKSLFEVFYFEKNEKIEEIAKEISKTIFQMEKSYDYSYYDPVELLLYDLGDSFVQKIEKHFQQQNENEKIVEIYLDQWKLCKQLSEYLDIAFNKAPFDPSPSENLKNFFKKYIFQKESINKLIMEYLNKTVETIQKDDELPEIFSKLLVICCQLQIYEFMGNEKLNFYLDSTLNDLKISKEMGYSLDEFEENDTEHTLNLQFYKNEIESQPEGALIEDIHKNWFGNWAKLERHHGYIQWLFPIQTGGMNFQSQPLSKFESEEFKKSDEIKTRVVKSYEMILDFFGLKLVDKTTGEVERNQETYEERYAFLSRSSHNYLRISRILKFFSILEFEQYQMNFLKFIIKEIFENQELLGLMNSLICYWIPTVLKESSLQQLEMLVMNLLKYSKISRKFYHYDTSCWANKRILDTETIDYSLIQKPILEFPVIESRYSSKPYEEIGTSFHKKEKKIYIKKYDTPLEDEDAEMGSLFEF